MFFTVSKRVHVEVSPLEKLRRISEPIAPAQAPNRIPPGHSSTVARAFSASFAVLTSKRGVDYLEIGSERGHSMTMVGTLLRAQGRLGQLVSVDPYALFHGPLMLLDLQVQLRADIERRFAAANRSLDPTDPHGRLSTSRWLYEATGLEVELIRAPSHQALLNLNRTFDLIYVDGWHTELGAWADIVLSLARLRNGGVLIIDDWHLPFMERLTPRLRALLSPGLFAETYKTLHVMVSRPLR